MSGTQEDRSLEAAQRPLGELVRREHLGKWVVDHSTPFRRSVEPVLASMRITLQSLDDGSYSGKRNQRSVAGVVPLVLEMDISSAEVKQILLRNTFSQSSAPSSTSSMILPDSPSSSEQASS